MMDHHICEMLQSLGITANYKGRRQIVLAVQLALKEEERLYNLTQEIYPVVAAQTHCGKGSVERNIRTAARVAWQVNPDLLQQMAGHPLDGAPSASQLITILTSRILRDYPNLPDSQSL